MLSALRKVLSFEMTIAEWIGTAVMLAAPYRIIGVLWPLIHSKDFANTHGLDRAVSVLGSIVVAGAVAVDGVPGMRPADCRIDIRRRTARWDPAAIVTAAEAMVFWAFAAGAANVIMQLSWPEVGYGVAESKVDSGNLLKHPWKRAGTTFQYLAVAILGRPEDRAAFREAVNSSYRQVKSTPDRCRGPTPGTSAARSCGLGRQRLPIRAGTAAARAPWRRRCRPSRSVLRRRDCRRRDCAPQWWFVGWQWIPLSSNVIRPSSSERRTPVHPSRRPYRWFRSSPRG